MATDKTDKTEEAQAAAKGEQPVEQPASSAAEPKGEAAKPAAAKVAKPRARKAPAKPTAKAAAAEAENASEAAAEPKKAPRARKPKAVAESAAAPKAPEKKVARAPKERPQPKAKSQPKTGAAGKATVVDAAGKQLETIDLDPAKFAVPANINTLHLVVRGTQAARRRGTASSKSRGEVNGSTAKLYRQKGTGRARVGSSKSPTRVGGGVAFGPHPRSYDIKINRKVVRKALLMALSDRAGDGNLFVARDLSLDVPSTARVNEFFVGLDIAAPVLLVTNDEPTLTLSTRNLVYAETAEVATLTTEQVLRARSLVLTEKAFNALNQA